MTDSRFFPWFEVGFAPADESISAAALTSTVPVNRNFFEADIRVHMRYALVGNSFEVTIAGLSGLLSNAIQVNKTKIQIKLGYYGGQDETVLEGIIKKKTARAGECFYETTLKGTEQIYHQLQNACLDEGVSFEPETRIGDVLERVRQAAGVNLHREGIIPAAEPNIPREWSFDRKSGLDALRLVENRLRRDESHHISLREGQIWYGRKVGILPNTGRPIPTIYSHDNYLAETKPVKEQRGGRRRVCRSSGNDQPETIGYDFEMLGDPRLHPGDQVQFKLKIDGTERIEQLTIESVTHKLSREGGYRCTGRALKTEQFLEQVFHAMAPGAETVGEEINNMVARNQERFPAVNVGDITDYTAEEHVVETRLGLEFEPTVTSPSVQARQDAEGFTLNRRPLASPFAWNLCGLVVPVYPGMRALAVHNRYLREDAVLNGFIWTEAMSPPPSQTGDYWLCLPLDAPDDRAPNTGDKAANDLIAGDGRRVIQLKGLRITVGEGLLPNLGSRPDEGANDELLIEHSSGAKITMQANQIELEAGGRTLTIANGKVSVT